MTAHIEKIASTSFSKRLAQFLVPHSANNHHPYLIRHEALFGFTLIILLVQFFSFAGVASSQVLGYATNITRSAIINLTNQERSERGIAAVKESALLNQSSTLKADHMFEHDYWAHYAPDGTSPWDFFEQVGYKYSWAGENLARGFSTSEGVVAGWMGSPSHRENMLNPNFTEIGIGIENGTLDGEQTTLVVEHLGNSLGASTSTPAEPTNGNVSTGQPDQVSDKFDPVEEKPVEPVSNADVNHVNEKIAAAESSDFQIQSFWLGLGVGQRTTLLLLVFLVALFSVDSVMIFRKGHARQNSHSLLHTGVLLILMFALIKGATGGVL
jgi:hypothetical protein